MKGALVLALLGTIVLATEARYVKNRRTNLQLSLARLFKQGGPPMGGPPMGGPPMDGPPEYDSEDDVSEKWWAEKEESSTKIHQVLKRLSMMKQGGGPGSGPGGPGSGPGGPGSGPGGPPCELEMLERCEMQDDMKDFIEEVYTDVYTDLGDFSVIQAEITTLVSSDVVSSLSTWMDAGWDEDAIPDIAGTVCPGSDANNTVVFWHVAGTGALFYASEAMGYTCPASEEKGGMPTGCPDVCPSVDDALDAILTFTACVRDMVEDDPDMVSEIRGVICSIAAGGPPGPPAQMTKEELLAELKKYLKNH